MSLENACNITEMIINFAFDLQCIRDAELIEPVADVQDYGDEVKA